MDVHAVFENINNIGITKTYALFLKRSHKRRKEKKLKRIYDSIIKKLNADVSLKDCSKKIQKYIKCLNDGVDLSFDSYQIELDHFCRESILPVIYNEYTTIPVEEKTVFVKFQGCTTRGTQFIYNKLLEKVGNQILSYDYDKSKDSLEFYDDVLDSLKNIATANQLFLYEMNQLMEYIQFRDDTKVIKIADYAEDCKYYLRYALEDDNDDSKAYKKEVKRLCIKEILPEVYSQFSVNPVEEKVVFLQPRSGLNQSFRYIYKKIKSEKLYKEKLHELHRGDVPDCEYYCNAIDFVKDMSTSKAVFEHESNDLLGYIDIRPETKVIQLWHGCGVFKKIGLDTYGKPGYKTMEEYNEYPEYNKYSCVTIASPELSWVFEQFMGISKESGIIQPIGISRTDEFFSEEYIQNCYKKLYDKIPEAKEKKVILYAPTYRGLGQNRVSPDQLDVKKFADALSEDYILIFKHHQTATVVPEIPEEYKDDFAYDMTRGKGMDINELMTIADICISDYSSLVFEYSLFERPMLFYVYDLEQYIDDRGLYYDFDEITPGPLCKTNDEMIDYIQHIDERFDKQVVTDFKNRFMCSCDGHSTERILDLIK